jgi:hypothetical protein
MQMYNVTLYFKMQYISRTELFHSSSLFESLPLYFVGFNKNCLLYFSIEDQQYDSLLTLTHDVVSKPMANNVSGH